MHVGRATSLAVGTAKASVGHSEAASGQIGLLKLQRVLRDTLMVGNSQLRVLNPLIGARMGLSSQFGLTTQGVSLSRRSARRRELVWLQRHDRARGAALRRSIKKPHGGWVPFKRNLLALLSL